MNENPQEKGTTSSPTGEEAGSKKDQILALYHGGITEVKDLAVITHSRPSYVATVLQENQVPSSYFDLYTSSAQPMNIYSKFFAKKLGFKDEETARKSIAHIDHYYRQFSLAQDRAGQHHALLMALTMFDRARWVGKEKEANVFRQWLLTQLQEPTPGAQEPAQEESSRPVKKPAGRKKSSQQSAISSQPTTKG